MNKKDAWDLLSKDYANYPEDFGGPVKAEIISDAEDQLGLDFSTSFKYFLSIYGSAILSGHIIYGLIPIDYMGAPINNLIKKTEFYRAQNWPDIEDWYIVSDDGFGNPIGIDPEGKVWLSDHDSGFEKVKLADSFEEFLYKVLTDTLYE